MALKSLIHFPIFAPPIPPSHHRRPVTEIRFSRWNNANAEEFIRRERTQKELEDQIRFEKRFNSALNIAHSYNPAPPHPTTFKSTGTPSSPSKPSIPGKFSKYSKKSSKKFNHEGPSHPAFRPIIRPRKIPEIGKDDETESQKEERVSVKVDEKGVVYEFPDAPFVYQYSYTETPKMKPVKIREPLVSPFGPDTIGRPWTGRKPLPPSKKKLPEFDSFKLPPPHKKGVKPVQSPGPFLEGTGPRYVKSREELLGEPLTKEEVEQLLKSCQKSDRQLNIGRDGLTHNMLENIHAHWKRRRLCKIKCKGVCTVDMDNVRQQLEEKTGGKIIYSKGGVIYLFRGRNYNYKTRPRFPLMLWRPVTPVYPRLIKRVPEGLTLEEATEMRKKGRNLTPICKLAKNGVYCDLAKTVREAFEACELVRINCQGLNGSDYRKIGAKLKDLVPCMLISFENEHILMWRGRNWKSSLADLEDDYKGVEESKTDNVAINEQDIEEHAESESVTNNVTVRNVISGNANATTLPGGSEAVETEGGNNLREEVVEDLKTHVDDMPVFHSDALSFVPEVNESKSPSHLGLSVDNSIAPNGSRRLSDGLGACNDETMVLSVGSDVRLGNSAADEGESDPSTISPLIGDNPKYTMDRSTSTISMPCAEGVLLLWKQAVERGSAIVLDGPDLDADIVYKRAVSLAKSIPPGPVFQYGLKRSRIHIVDKLVVGDTEELVVGDTEEKGISALHGKEAKVSNRKEGKRKGPKYNSMKGIKEDYLNVAPQGSLRVDELAKLLA